MPVNGIDEAWSRLTAAQLQAAGKAWVAAYVSEDSSGKNITSAEVTALRAGGIGLYLVYEYATNAVEGGAAKGTRDAGIAIAQAIALGYPMGRTIAFAVDEDETPHPSHVDAYAKAFTAACHAAGYKAAEYGGLATVKWCADHGITDGHWQTYAWSGTPTVWDPRATIRQIANGRSYAGKQVDDDVALVADFGAWGFETEGEDDDDMQVVETSLSATAQTLAAWGAGHVVEFSVENADPTGQHAKGVAPGLVAAFSAYLRGTFDGRIGGSQVGDPYQVKLLQYKWDTKTGQHVGDPATQILADDVCTTGDQYINVPINHYSDAGLHNYISVTVWNGTTGGEERTVPTLEHGRLATFQFRP